MPTGTVVGVAFGTAFIGAFLALLVIWIFLRLSRRSRRAGEKSLLDDKSHIGNFSRPKDNNIRKGVPVSIVPLDDIPLEPADDSQIRKSMQDLYELIHQHVENHYSARNFQGRPEDLKRQLAQRGWSDQTEPLAESITSLLINSVTRRVAIRHIIAWIIFQHIDLKNSSETSLLPSHFLASGQAMLKIKRTSREQEGNISHSGRPLLKILNFILQKLTMMAL